MYSFEIVRLTPEDRQQLSEIAKKGAKKSRKVLLSMALLWCDQAPGGPGQTDFYICSILGLGKDTLSMAKKLYNEHGIIAAVNYKPNDDMPGKVDTEFEEKLIALAGSTPPFGRSAWSVRLLAHYAVKEKLISSISHMTVYRVLKKHNLASSLEKSAL
ncbi:MAG: helix-turn-helix domain-containing protein [Deltaproteobacteria bacterium]|jgi:hypothetical protein|nr:helix-turn-helix domain-containing protein [Deltaproteobacteria bacterium]